MNEYPVGSRFFWYLSSLVTRFDFFVHWHLWDTPRAYVLVYVRLVRPACTRVMCFFNRAGRAVYDRQRATYRDNEIPF